jgi:hypothetical protein
LVEPVVLVPWPATRLAHEAGLICELIPDEELEPGREARLVGRVRATAADHGAEAIVLDAHRSPLAMRVATDVGSVPVVLTGPPSAGAGAVLSGSSVPMSVQWDDLALQARGAALSVPVGGLADEALPAAAARAELGLPLREPLALLPAAQALLDEGWSVVVPELPLGDGELRLPAAVNRIRARPLWRYLVAFDIAVASAGYSLTHELVAARLPSLLVPFSDRSGQAERSAGARSRGLALGLERFAEAPFGAAIRELGDSGTRARLAAACQAVDLRDGTSRLTDALGLASRPCAGDSDFARGVV